MYPDISIAHGKLNNLIFRTYYTLDNISNVVERDFHIAVRKFASFLNNFVHNLFTGGKFTLFLNTSSKIPPLFLEYAARHELQIWRYTWFEVH